MRERERERERRGEGVGLQLKVREGNRKVKRADTLLPYP